LKEIIGLNHDKRQRKETCSMDIRIRPYRF